MVFNLSAVTTRNQSHTGNLEIHKMMNNPDLTVRIGIGKGAGTTDKDVYRYITGALVGDLGFSLGNSWTSLVPLNSIPIASDIASGVGAVVGALSGASQMSLESVYMTSASWKGCEIPKIPIQVAFVNYAPSLNCFNELLELSKGALPPDISYNPSDAGKLSDIASMPKKWARSVGDWVRETELLKDFNERENWATQIENMAEIGQEAPLGYGLEPSKENGAFFIPKTGTTFQVRIGNWFHASNLIMENINMQFSKEVLPSGMPVYATASITLRPYRQISWIEFAQYFIKAPTTITSQLIQENSKVANAAVNEQESKEQLPEIKAEKIKPPIKVSTSVVEEASKELIQGGDDSNSIVAEQPTKVDPFQAEKDAMWKWVSGRDEPYTGQRYMSWRNPDGTYTEELNGKLL